jgi:hypothetical protein
MTDFQVNGADQFLRLSRAFKEAGRSDLRKELNKGLRDGVKPLTPLTRTAALRALPRGGGLNQLVAKTPQRVKVSTGRDPGVTLIAGRKGSGAGGADIGVVRHPTFGNKAVWRETQVLPGWLTATVKTHIGDVIPALEQALERVAEKVVRGG